MPQNASLGTARKFESFIMAKPIKQPFPCRTVVNASVVSWCPAFEGGGGTKSGSSTSFSSLSLGRCYYRFK